MTRKQESVKIKKQWKKSNLEWQKAMRITAKKQEISCFYSSADVNSKKKAYSVGTVMNESGYGEWDGQLKIM